MTCPPVHNILSWNHVSVWICLEFVLFLLVTNFHIGNFFLRNENYCIPRCFISFLMQSRHLLSFLIVEPTLIWSESISWKIIEESYFFVGYNLNTYFIRAREGRDVGLWHKWLLLKSNAKYRKRGDRVGDQTDRIVKLSHLNVFAEFEYIIEFSLLFSRDKRWELVDINSVFEFDEL